MYSETISWGRESSVKKEPIRTVTDQSRVLTHIDYTLLPKIQNKIKPFDNFSYSFETGHKI